MKEELQPDREFIGYVKGQLDAHDIPVKALPIHKSTVSRLFNGKVKIDNCQLWQLAFAAGRIAERQQRQAA